MGDLFEDFTLDEVRQFAVHYFAYYKRVVVMPGCIYINITSDDPEEPGWRKLNPHELEQMRWAMIDAACYDPTLEQIGDPAQKEHENDRAKKCDAGRPGQTSLSDNLPFSRRGVI